MSKKLWLSGKRVPPPYTEKFFFEDLHDLGHERKKRKKSVKMTQFCHDTPPPNVKFHTFFLFVWEPPYLRDKVYRFHEIFIYFYQFAGNF